MNPRRSGEPEFGEQGERDDRSYPSASHDPLERIVALLRGQDVLGQPVDTAEDAQELLVRGIPGEALAHLMRVTGRAQTAPLVEGEGGVEALRDKRQGGCRRPRSRDRCAASSGAADKRAGDGALGRVGTETPRRREARSRCRLRQDQS